MPNKIYPQEKSELYNQIETQAGKVNFLTEEMKRCNDLGFISAPIEIDYNDKGFAELMSRIKERCSISAHELISEQLIQEETVLKNLSKQAIKD